MLSAAAATVLLAAAQQAGAAPVPPSPKVGDCLECVGEVNETLNNCKLDSKSCVSTTSDDSVHFEAPWQFDGDRNAAIAQLLAVATGGAYDPGLINTFGAISQTDAAAYIAKGVLAVATGGDMPEQPKRQRKQKNDYVPFDGAVVERRTTPAGAEYVRVVLGTAGGAAADVADPSSVIDAEFLFLADDTIVNVRAASRAEPEGGLRSGGRLALSFTDGLVVDKNVARRRLEALRTALRWEVVPVVTDFNTMFNAEAPVFVEKLFDPFSQRASFEPSGMSYPAEGGK